MPRTTTGFPNGIDFGDPTNEALSKVPGVPAQGILRVASNVAGAETVVIGADTYRVAIVNTDSTKTVAGGELNNTDQFSKLTMASHGLKGGDLVRCQNEIMLVLQWLDANHVLLKRGVSGTTIATHADGQALYTEASPGAGNIAVGLVTTLTPTAFTAALVADINNRGVGPYAATLIDANTVLVYTADKPGGNPESYGTNVAVSETLAGANNAWDAANLVGRVASIPRIYPIVPLAAEVTAGKIERIFPFAPTVIGAFMQTTATRAAANYDGVITVTGNRVTLDNTGTADFAATHTIFLIIE